MLSNLNVNDSSGIAYKSSIDTKNYPSDEIAKHYIYTFNPATGINEKQEEKEYDAAIFFNKEGFDADVHTYYSQEDNAKNINKAGEPIYGSYQDSIIIAPTGQSGAKYNKHDGTSDKEVNQDIQELQIMLPSLGNTISDVWDIVYGYTNKVSPEGKVTTTTDRKRFRDIQWKDAVAIEEDELTGHTAEDTSIGGMTRDLSTLAGCINKVHDLMGMIITQANEDYLNQEWFNKNYIYSKEDKFYRIH